MKDHRLSIGHRADAYSRDAAVAAETAEALVLARRVNPGED